MAERQVWRVRRTARLAGPIVAAGAFGFWGVVALVDSLPSLLLVGAGSTALCLALWFPFVERPRIALGSEDVTVVNPFSTRRIRLDEIQGVEGGYDGLELRLRDGTTVTAWAVQKANWAQWTGRRTRADDAAQAIMDAARRG